MTVRPITSRFAVSLVALATLALAGSAHATAPAKPDHGDHDGHRGGRFRATLCGYEEVPAISSDGRGSFRATIENEATIRYELTYRDLEASVTVAHIHLGQPGVAGGVIAFLCGGGGKPACPPAPATVEGTVTAADVAGPTGQGIAAGEFDELLRAMRAGLTYANVHSTMFPTGEIRGQILGVGGSRAHGGCREASCCLPCLGLDRDDRKGGGKDDGPEDGNGGGEPDGEDGPVMPTTEQH
jgi:hypothetical protein